MVLHFFKEQLTKTSKMVILTPSVNCFDWEEYALPPGKEKRRLVKGAAGAVRKVAPELRR